jgi:uncharacterized sulfatase
MKHLTKTSFGVLLASSLAGCTSVEKPEQPNLLFIFPDQMRQMSFGVDKTDPVITPNLDRFAKESLELTNAVSTCPLSSPYRGMLMTGKYPFNNGVIGNCQSRNAKYDVTWKESDTSFSDVLYHAGYNTAYVGKLHLTSPAPSGTGEIIYNAYTPKNERHNFEYWYSYGSEDVHMAPAYWIGDAPESDFKRFNEWSPKHEADVIIDYLKNGSKQRSGKKPFALFWSINPPHPPYDQVPQEYLEYYKDKTYKDLLTRPNVSYGKVAGELESHIGGTKNRTHLAQKYAQHYFAAITGVDEQIGRVLEALKDLGLDKNTIVVFTADHGEMMASHALMSKNIWFEESMCVPFAIRWPEKIESGVNRAAMLSPQDLMPSILSLMGLKKDLPKNLDGRDFSLLFRGEKDDMPQWAFYFYNDIGQPNIGTRGLRTETHTFAVIANRNGSFQYFLYDRTKDPFELTNIAYTNKKLCREIALELRDKLLNTNDPWIKVNEKGLLNL